MSMDRDAFSFPQATIADFIGRLLMAAGCSARNATTAADVFLRATLRGKGHHDIYTLGDRLESLTRRRIEPNPTLALVSRCRAVLCFDGGGGLGEICCSFITEQAIRLAQRFGIGFCAIRHSNHFLSASPYAERVAESGGLGLILSNTLPCMTGPEKNVNIIGNNPLGFAMPYEEYFPLLLDIAMSYASWGKIDETIAAGEMVPAYWGKDAQGRPCIDPKQIRSGGTLRPMGDHKGLGLAILNEILSAGVADGELAGELNASRGVGTHSQAALVIAIGRILPKTRFTKRLHAMMQSMKDRDASIRTPGEQSAANRTRCLKEGIVLKKELVGELNAWAERLRVRPLPTG